MKQILYCLLIALSFVTTVVPLTVNSTLLENEKTGKRVLLLGEMHTSYTKKTLNDAQKDAYDIVEQQQKQSFATLANNLLALDSQQGAQTVVISETGFNTVGNHFEQELGLVPVNDQDDETMHVMPRLFMKNILAPAATVDEKTALFQSSVKPFNGTQAASFVFNNQMRWVVGDTWRKEKDRLLTFTVCQYWESILESLKNKEQMPAELAELSVTNVKEYIGSWHDEFANNGINDPYSQKIIATIDGILKTGTISESDHIAKVHEYLHTNDQRLERDNLNNNILCFISLKTDLELRTYIQEFENDSVLKHLIVNYGILHAETIKNILLKDGYTVIERNGYTEYSEPQTEQELKEIVLNALQCVQGYPNLVIANKLFQA